MRTLSRRSFLAQSAAVSAGALVAAQLSPVVRALPAVGPAGIQLYAVKDSLAADPAATLRRLKEIGYREVETAGFAGLSSRDFRRLLDDNDLKAPSAHLDFASPAVALDDAHALGAQYAASGSLRALIPGGPHTGGMTIEEAHHTAELANRLGDEARHAGLRYVYHNHNFEFARAGDGTCYDLLLAETDPALVEFEIDCGWMVIGGGNPIDYFRRHPQRFPMIHVKDFLPAARSGGAAGATAEYPGAELGQGIIDYGPIFTAARKAGLKHYFVEQEGPFTRMSQLEAARQALAYLGRLR